MAHQWHSNLGDIQSFARQDIISVQAIYLLCKNILIEKQKLNMCLENGQIIISHRLMVFHVKEMEFKSADSGCRTNLPTLGWHPFD